jgi:hypothetical protein
LIAWLGLGILVVTVLGYMAMLLFRPAKLKYLLACEYWVYLPTAKPPSQDELMTRLIRDNPLRVNGQPAIGPAEGLLFSDIRLHTALVLRSKNPHVFRPDLFETHVEPTAEDLANLSESPALQKVRYVSEEPLRDDRYLQLLPHMAVAVAELSGAKVVFDTVAEKLFNVAWLKQELEKTADATRPDLHLRVIWKTSDGGGHAETRGLVKIGLPEIATEPSNADQKVLLTTVLEEAATLVWEARSLPLKLFVEVYQDMFELHLTPTTKGPYKARVFRAQMA